MTQEEFDLFNSNLAEAIAKLYKATSLGVITFEKFLDIQMGFFEAVATTTNHPDFEKLMEENTAEKSLFS